MTLDYTDMFHLPSHVLSVGIISIVVPGLFYFWCFARKAASNLMVVLAKCTGLLFPNAVIFQLCPVLCGPHGYDPYLTSLCTATTALRLSL